MKIDNSLAILRIGLALIIFCAAIIVNRADQTAIAASPAPVLSVSGGRISPTTGIRWNPNVSWTSVSGVSRYQCDYKTRPAYIFSVHGSCTPSRIRSANVIFEYLKVRGKLSNGQNSNWSNTVRNFGFDRTAPPKPALSHGINRVSWPNRINASMYERYECRVNNGGWRACRSPQTLPYTGGAQHEFSVRAIDDAGNSRTSTVLFCRAQRGQKCPSGTTR